MTGATLELYRPPAPEPLPPLRALIRALARRERDLLGLLPEGAYRSLIAPLGNSRRQILLVNDPALVREVLVDRVESFPKNDLFVGALEPLIGQGVFISSGEVWRRQRSMIEPAFSHMHVRTAFPLMEAASELFISRLDAAAASGRPVALDALMSQLAADVICRALFSTTLDDGDARDLFSAFAVFQAHVANVNVLQLLLGRPWAQIPQPTAAQEAAGRIRAHVDRMLRARLDGTNRPTTPDIADALIEARDPLSGQAFSHDDLIDQISVFFLAGHETSASTLSWALYLLSQQPDHQDRIRAETAAVAGGDLAFEGTKRLVFTRKVIRETLRLYPPGPFLPRVAAKATELGGHRVKQGAMIMISPWLIHRHRLFWSDADRFVPERFGAKGETGNPQGTYLPFGLGPRVCVGAAFALTETVFILAKLACRYRFTPTDPQAVRPVARLTIGSAASIQVRVERG